jgi:hypothetical protein
MLITQEQVNKYPWGLVITVHSIGEYDIIESYPNEYKNGRGTGEIDYNHKQYHPYINGKDTNHSYYTLEGALIGAIAQKFDGLNSQAAMYFCKMVGIKQEIE